MKTKIITVPTRIMPHADPNCCFINVERAVKKNGGEIVFGWRVDRLGDVIMSLTHHAVWKMPDNIDGGGLREITPYISEVIEDVNALTILTPSEFIPDPEAIWEPGKLMPNKFVALRNDPKLQKACHYLTVGEDAFYRGEDEKHLYWNEKANEYLRKRFRFDVPPLQKVLRDKMAWGSNA